MPLQTWSRYGDHQRQVGEGVALRGLAGRVAVVAGGATGIGATTAARLGAEGCHVVVGDIAIDGSTTHR